jgi:hypothetical protein
MWTFIIAGALYLIGVAVVLVLRPAFMFTPEGNWKEFGIGQRPDRYTPFPFWMFCLVWAVVAYSIVLLVQKLYGPMESANNNFGRRNNRRNNLVTPLPPPVREIIETPLEDAQDAIEEAVELPKGYYVLNKKATRITGAPKYVYIGPEEPGD